MELNLWRELIRENVSINTVAETLKLAKEEFISRLKGSTRFSREEKLRIRNTFLPFESISYLFSPRKFNRFQITLRMARMNRGISTEKAAFLSGISKRTIERWEVDTKGGYMEGFMKLLSVYGVSIDHVYIGRESDGLELMQHSLPQSDCSKGTTERATGGTSSGGTKLSSVF